MNRATLQQLIEDGFNAYGNYQSGFDLGSESTDNYVLMSKILNAAGQVLPTLGPAGAAFAIGINQAASVNNTVSAVKKFQDGTLQPSDVLQITSSILGGLAGLAVLTGGAIPIAVIITLGVIGISSGPSKLQEVIDDFFKLTGELLVPTSDPLDEVRDLYFNSARQRGDASPLVLDLDGDGVETIGINDSYAYFDHNRDGFAERTGWAGADDGILVRDLNGNGQIDNGGELFGDNTLVNGARAANGFEALKALDTNRDGQFNNADTTWNSVKVWKDSNSNTLVDSGEMLTLAQANVASIDLGYYNNYGYGLEANGNDHRQVSYYQDTSGNYKSISDVWFKANRTDSVDTVQVPISTTIQSLFDLRGSGTLVSLHKAMALDSTGSLQAFVSQLQTKLAGNHTVAQLHQDTRQLLLKWASAENLPAEVYDTGSDAREIAVLEKVLGIPFKEVLAQFDFVAVTGDVISLAFQLVQTEIATEILKQTKFKPVLDSIDLNFNATTNQIEFDLTDAAAKLKLLTNGLSTIDQIATLSFFKKAIGVTPGQISNTLAAGFEQAYASDPALLNLWKIANAQDFRFGSSSTDTLYNGANVQTEYESALISGNAGDDSLMGVGNVGHILDGGTGNDNLSSYYGNDILIGGQGSDTLSAGFGADQFWYKKGDGHDTLSVFKDSSNTDTLKLLDIKSTEVTLQRNVDDLLIRINGRNSDSITVSKHFEQPGSYNYALTEIMFSDGVKWNESIIASKVLAKTLGDDIITGYAGADSLIGNNGNDTLFGQDGNDTLNGQTGNDYLFGEMGSDKLYGGNDQDRLDGGDGTDQLYGQSGNDQLFGGSGNDLLDGGLGDDTLYGDAGNDTYQYRKGDGRDLIGGNTYNANDTETLKLLNALPSEIKLYRDNQDLLISIVSNPNDFVRVVNHFDFHGTGQHFLDRIQFSDGSIWTSATFNPKAVAYVSTVNTRYGTANSESLTGTAGADDIYGRDGNDTLEGGLGDDILRGENGNDTYVFRKGHGRDQIDPLYGSSNVLSDTDTLRMVETASTDVVLVRHNSDLLITFKSSPNDSIRVLNQFDSYDDALNPLDLIVFSDSVNWNASTIRAKTQIKTSSDDQLFGSAANNTLAGGDGNDFISGLNGADRLYGENGNDYINGGDGNDTLFGGNDSDYLNGDDGDDILKGDAGNDQLYGNEGNDTLEGSAGDDLMHGGSGNNTFMYSRDHGRDVINLTPHYYATENFVNTLRLTNIASSDAILSRSYHDLIIRFKINTSDQITIQDYFSNGGTTTMALDNIVFSDGVTWSLSKINMDVLLGTNNNDYLAGYDTATNQLDGKDGADFIVGGQANDTLFGGNGDDSISGQAGDDTIDGGAGHDYAYGGLGHDNIKGGLGADRLYGDEGNDRIEGGTGNDTLNGGLGADTYVFKTGDGQDLIENLQTYSTLAETDTISFTNLSSSQIKFAREMDDLVITNTVNTFDSIRIKDQFYLDGNSVLSIDSISFSDGVSWNASQIRAKAIVGTNGADNLIGYASADTIRGQADHDWIQGRDGNDSLYGDSGDDYLNGENGNDTLDGGTGQDQLNGGIGNDIFLYRKNQGKDTVYVSDGSSSNYLESLRLLDMNSNAVKFGRFNNDLYVQQIGSSLDHVKIMNHFSGNTADVLDKVIFSDGVQWDVIKINSTTVNLAENPDYA